MSTADAIQHHLQQQIKPLLKPDRIFWIAYSTGADSTALLHAMAQLSSSLPCSCKAIHINHGLQDDAAAWQQHAETTSARFGIDFVTETIQVTATGQGIEAAARDSRYSAFSDHLKNDDVLLTAHHQDDQAETLLLQLLRGSGIRGLSGIPRIRELPSGQVLRPFLGVSRKQLLDYCATHHLSYTRDSSNNNTRFDRNWLRAEILPVLEQRFAGSTANLAFSAELLSNSNALASAHIERLLQSALLSEHELFVPGLLEHTPATRFELLRLFIETRQLPAPGREQIMEFLRQLESADDDRHPALQLSQQHSLRSYKNSITISNANSPEFPPEHTWGGHIAWQWPTIGQLSLQGQLPEAAAPMPVFEIRQRQGGEQIKLTDGHHHRVKKLLQQAAIPPWKREQLPFIFHHNKLQAVADQFVSGALKRWLTRYNLQLHWQPEDEQQHG